VSGATSHLGNGSKDANSPLYAPLASARTDESIELGRRPRYMQERNSRHTEETLFDAHREINEDDDGGDAYWEQEPIADEVTSGRRVR
jgi:hypothetical protein